MISVKMMEYAVPSTCPFKDTGKPQAVTITPNFLTILESSLRLHHPSKYCIKGKEL